MTQPKMPSLTSVIVKAWTTCLQRTKGKGVLQWQDIEKELYRKHKAALRHYSKELHRDGLRVKITSLMRRSKSTSDSKESVMQSTFGIMFGLPPMLYTPSIDADMQTDHLAKNPGLLLEIIEYREKQMADDLEMTNRLKNFYDYIINQSQGQSQVSP
jgi:hypothetical protein